MIRAIISVACLLFMFHYTYGKMKLKNMVTVDSIKNYKKVLKTHTNVLTLYSKDEKSAHSFLKWMEDLAKEIKGKGTFVFINCGENKESKKLCKKYSVNPHPKILKHYKDGSFHKDYDRKETAKSMLNFMLDPSGDVPWEEDPSARDVVQINTEKELNKLRRKEKGQLLIMFYAPWCGYCKKLKPDFSAAATELKGKSVLAGMDVDKSDAFNVRYQFNITGFPTIIYFEKGEEKYRFNGKHDKQGIIDWLEDPKPDSAVKKEEEEESWSTIALEILHLTDATFDESLKINPSIIVMFYAPWCGHCKTMKPEYVEAAKQMKEEEIAGTLAAVDCTKETATCKKFGVDGYPTIKYFENGEDKFKLSLRTKDKIIEFMKNPEAPPPPPPEDLPWAEVSSPEILHLGDSNFKDDLKKKKHVLVMFYAPWCGHCKKAKPEIEVAAAHYKDDRKVWFAGVDCTVHKKSCEQFDVSGYPTFRYFLYGKKDFAYNGGRSSEGFIEFMKDPTDKPAKPQHEEPDWKDTPSGVVHLEDEDFDEFIRGHSSVLVMFYAPWCGHCKSMKPAYTEAANELLDQDHILAAVDCTKHRKVASKYDISGYPTIKYFKDGKDTEYEGGRSKEAIVQFLSGAKDTEGQKPAIGPTWADENQDVKHLDGSSFDSFVQQNPSVLIMFYAPWCGHCKRMKPAFAAAAKRINTENQVSGQLCAVDCTVDTAVCSRFDVRGYPTLLYFKNGEKEMNYDGGRGEDDFVSFMKDPKPAPPPPVETPWSEENTDVSHLTKDNFEDFVSEHKSVLVMFYAPWCGHCKKMKPAYGEAARVANEDERISGKLAAVDCDANPSIAAKYDVKGYPTLKYFENGKDKMKYQDDRTTEALVKFIRNPSGDDKPKVPEWKDTPSDVHHLTDENFDDFLKDQEALVMFYAPWCGHCTEMKPAYMEAATKLKNDGVPSVLAAVDATRWKTTAKREGTKGYPTLKYYSKGQFVQEFEEHRTVENIMNFMKTMLDSSNRKTSSDLDSDNFEDIPSSVAHLTKDNFDDHLSNIPHALVMFHVKWCKECVEIRNALMQAASRLSGQTTYGFSALNCETEGEHCNSQGVTAFPTISYYAYGKLVEKYSGVMTTDGFVSYLQLKAKEEL